MMIMTSAIAISIAYTRHQLTYASHYFGIASGIVSAAFGTFLVYRIGFADGLFMAHTLDSPVDDAH